MGTDPVAGFGLRRAARSLRQNLVAAGAACAVVLAAEGCLLARCLAHVARAGPHGQVCPIGPLARTAVVARLVDRLMGAL